MSIQTATLAAHRFGYGEPDLTALRSDPKGWVLSQWSAPPRALQDGIVLMTSSQALSLGRRVLRASLQAQPVGGSAVGSAVGMQQSTAQPLAALTPQPMAATTSPSMTSDADPLASGPDRQALRREGGQALVSRWQRVVESPAPVLERWSLFWFNHFCVAATKGSMIGMVWPFEREAIRPHVQGRFVDLLTAATTHPSMLLYLDNALSFGPNADASRQGRRARGLNENHARELLELHTLGVNGGYQQADVTELARLMTGWTVRRELDPDIDGSPTRFVAAVHEPGDKRVLGKIYPEGRDALGALLIDLARHPSTARNLSTKLVRHFVSDQPPAALVDAVAARWQSSDGDLNAVAQTLFSHPLAWSAERATKFKTPEELLLSAHRVLQRPVGPPERWVSVLTQLGQTPGRAPSPQGWPDTQADWLAPDALWKRVEWASDWANSVGADVDARQRAAASFGIDLGDDTRRQIERADSGVQALALWLASPEFQRR